MAPPRVGVRVDPFSVVGMAPPRVVRGPGGPLLGWWVWLHQGLLGVRVDPFSVVGMAPPRVVRGPGGPLLGGGYGSTKGC